MTGLFCDAFDPTAVCSACLEMIGKVLSDSKEKISQLVCFYVFISVQLLLHQIE